MEESGKASLLWERNVDHMQETNVCIICLDPIALGGGYVFDCGHRLHTQCFHKYFYYNYDVETNHVTCPFCRFDIGGDVESNDASSIGRRRNRNRNRLWRWGSHLLMQGAAISACLLLFCCGIIARDDNDNDDA